MLIFPLLLARMLLIFLVYFRIVPLWCLYNYQLLSLILLNIWIPLEIDPYGIYPPWSSLTGGPNPTDSGVVGAIGGTVDVGMMGAAVYTIPIELPEGINGMQPSLAITYNSQAGNGLLGWGWDLAGLSCIERTGQTRYHDGAVGAVTLNDATDRFMLDGKRLIAVANYTDSVEYKTEQDEMSKVMAYYAWSTSFGKESMGPVFTISHFKVWKPDGMILEYGCEGTPQKDQYSQRKE